MPATGQAETLAHLRHWFLDSGPAEDHNLRSNVCASNVLAAPAAGTLRMRLARGRETTEMRQPLPTGAVKPGWTTTEFWTTLLIHIIAAVVALGTVFHTHFNLNGLQAIVPTVALVAAALAQSMYSHSRAAVKSSAQAAGAQARTEAPAVSGGHTTNIESAPIVVKLTGIQPVSSNRGRIWDRRPGAQ